MFSDDAIRVLCGLQSDGDDLVEYAQTHAWRLDMSKADVLRHCRKFRDHGYARLSVLVDPDEGTPKGSAYVRTEKGNALLSLTLGPDWRDAA